METSSKSGRLLNHDHILLTGATGVLGAYVLKELLLETNSKIYCLLRGEDLNQAFERALTYLKVYDPEGKAEIPFRERVIPLLGDITNPHLGLKPEQYNELTRVIDATLHVAACTNLIGDINTASLINVGGTQNAINFALKTSQRYLAYVSSYSVLGDRSFIKDFIFKETDFDVGQGFKYFPYQETKFMAEKLVRTAGVEQGLLWNIFRPGQIYGDSATGAYPFTHNNFGGLFYDFFKTLMTLEVLPDSNWMFDVSPVDYVSKALVFLALNRPSYGETYHLTNPHIRPFIETFPALGEVGYNLRIVPVEQYLRGLMESAQKNGGVRSITAKIFGFWYKTGVFNFQDSAKVDATYTSKILQPAGIVCPKIDYHLFKTYVDRGVEEGFFPAPTTQLRNEAVEAVQSGTEGPI